MTPSMYETPVLGGDSPWGTIETIVYFDDGLTYVKTLTHGGFHLGFHRTMGVPESWRLLRYHGNAIGDLATSPWFEEDFDAAMVVLWHPGKFNMKQRSAAWLTYENHFRPKLAKDGAAA